MSRDVEAPPTTPPAAGLGGIPKRRQLCLLFGLISISWGGFLVYLMYHGVHVTDRQSYMDNLDFKGANIDSIFGVETANACYKRCEEHESCLAYTYVKSEHVCWLKGEGYTAKSNPNTVSGAINATLADIRRSSAGSHTNGSFGAFDSDSYPEEGEGGRELDREFDSTRADEWDNDDDGNYRADEEGVDGVDRVRASKQDIERYEDNTDFFGDIRLFTEVRRPRAHQPAAHQPAAHKPAAPEPAAPGRPTDLRLADLLLPPVPVAASTGQCLLPTSFVDDDYCAGSGQDAPVRA